MNTAIVVTMHGLASEQLLKTTEMILGKQNNVTCVNFMLGENTETLIEKCFKNLSLLDVTDGVLFLVDIWGGSPFNAAKRIIIGKDNYEVITGVNVPMLIEIFMTRNDISVFQELIEIAVETGRIGIKTSKNLNPENLIVSNASSKAKLASKTILPVTNHNGSMNIILARIDDRLIHGQVATRWTKEINITRIIVINDEVAQDKVRKTLLTQVAPPGITAHVVSIAKAVRVYYNPKYANERVMFLFTNPTDVLRIIEDGVEITSVNIGGMAFRQDKIQVNHAISVDKKDIKAFKKLYNLGVELEVRKVYSDSSLNMMDLIKKLDN